MNPDSVALTAIAALGTYGIIRMLSRQRAYKSDDKVGWSPLEAVAITITLFFVPQVLVSLLVYGYAEITQTPGEQINSFINGTPAAQFAFIALVQGLMIAALYWFLKRRKTAWSKIGWIRPRGTDILYALSGFGAYFVLYGVVIAQLVEQYLPVDTEQRQQLGFDTSLMGPELIFVFMSLVILPPLIEEIVVRGFLFSGLKAKLAFIPAALITSIVFGAAHLQWGSDAPLLWTAAIDTFVLSMVLVYLRHKTGSLWPGIGVHFIKNGLAFLALFIFKVV